MKRIAWFFSMVCLVTALSAQPRGQRPAPDPADRAQRIAAHLTSQLQLNNQQAKKVEESFLTHFQEKEKLATNGQRPDPEAMKALREKQDEKLKSILSKDQYAKYIQLREDRMAQRGGKHGKGGEQGGPHPGPDGHRGKGGPDRS
jgi:Skp family chaperone for outer membrane proteins